MARDDARRENQPPGSVRIGSLVGVDVYILSSWWVVAALIAFLLEPRVEDVHPGLGAWKYVVGVAIAVLLYGAILLHEMSHAVVAKRAGLPVRSITIQFLGGSTQIDAESRTAGEEFRIAVVGPLTSLAVGLAALGLLRTDPSGLTRLAIEVLAGSNLVIGVLNLVPGLPLDGGRVLRAAVWKTRGNMHTGTIAAAWGGRVAAVLALFWPTTAQLFTDSDPSTFDYIFAFMVAAFLWSGASASMANAQIRRRLPALRARPLARRVAVVDAGLSVAQAVAQAQQIGAGGIATTSADGALTGIVNEAALLSIPEERRPWVPVSSIARTLTDGLVISADLDGEALVRAMARTPATEYLLSEPDGTLYGLLVTTDVDAAFAAGVRK